jgi:hypothetical protein
VRNTAPSAGLDEKAQGTLIQKFTEKTHADFFSNAATAALTSGNVDALRQLREQIAGPDGDPMDPQRRATLTHTIFGWEQSILARQDRLANTAAEEARRATTRRRTCSTRARTSRWPAATSPPSSSRRWWRPRPAPRWRRACRP